MPTLAELKAAYPDMQEQELTQRWAAKHPGEPLTETAPAQAPSMLSRVKDVATSPMVLKTLGTMGGLALAPETGGASALAMAALLGGAGSAAGGLASKAANGQTETLGDVAGDAAEGASAPFIGPALKGAASAARTVGESIPAFVKGYGLFTHPMATLGIEAATHPKGLPSALDAIGDVANWTTGKLRGAAYSVKDNIVDPLEARTRALVNRLTGASEEVPYRMEGKVSGPTSKVPPRPSAPAATTQAPAPAIPESVSALSKATGRPAPDFVHPPDTSGAAFGFDSLPELPESELSRLQALFSRLGH